MKKAFFYFFSFIISLNISAQIPSSYYNSAIELTGYTLKSELHSIIASGHSDQGYGYLYVGYETTDSDNYYENDGSVLDMYSENPSGTDPYYYTHGNNTCGTYSGENDCYNREHIVPQSVFGSASPMRNDIHFVVPSDGYVNNRRSSYAFGEVSSPSWTSLNGSKVGSNTYGSFTGTVFEPIDEFKGDIARMLFYFATRYETQVDSWSHDMFNGTEDQVFADWFLDMILEWHQNDPVSTREIDRNNAAYNYQGNANPFISHPEWVNIIWNPTPDNENPTAPSSLIVTSVTSTSISLSWNPSTDNVGVIGYKIYKNGVSIATSANTNYTANGLTPNTNYTFYITAIDAATNESTASNSVVGTTDTASSVFLINENFNDCTNVGDSFVTYNEASDKDWTCSSVFGYDNSGCYQMNGYLEDVLSRDWLITTNKISFSTYLNEKISIYFKYKFGSTPLSLLYSYNYPGSGNPADYTWFEVPNVSIDTPTGATEGTQQITEVSISGITQNAYLAFKYYSDGAPTRWTVDNFIISANTGAGVNSTDIDNYISIYPNPSDSEVYLNVNPNILIYAISIYSSNGDLLRKKINNQRKINIKGIPNGIYFLKLKTNKGVFMKKIVINPTY
jgi:endonuclease I/chitodextrinase